MERSASKKRIPQRKNERRRAKRRNETRRGCNTTTSSSSSGERATGLQGRDHAKETVESSRGHRRSRDAVCVPDRLFRSPCARPRCSSISPALILVGHGQRWRHGIWGCASLLDLYTSRSLMNHDHSLPSALPLHAVYHLIQSSTPPPPPFPFLHFLSSFSRPPASPPLPR